MKNSWSEIISTASLLKWSWPAPHSDYMRRKLDKVRKEISASVCVLNFQFFSFFSGLTAGTSREQLSLSAVSLSRRSAFTVLPVQRESSYQLWARRQGQKRALFPDFFLFFFCLLIPSCFSLPIQHAEQFFRHAYMFTTFVDYQMLFWSTNCI